MRSDRPRLRPSTGADGWAAKGGQHAGRPGAFGRGNIVHVLNFPNVLHRSYSHRYPQALRDYSHPHAAHHTTGCRWSDKVESSGLMAPMVGWSAACSDTGPSPRKEAEFPEKLTNVRRFSKHDLGSKIGAGVVGKHVSRETEAETCHRHRSKKNGPVRPRYLQANSRSGLD